MSSVLIFVPNGRRQTIKCTPNTTILQMIEDVCKKQGFNSDEYDLKHHNKILDTTTTFRFSGLPNNAQLELVPAVRPRTESEVVLALTLESGERFIGNFQPSQNLLDVLMQLCPQEAALERNPVVIYTRREIYGDDLQKTTLKSLGLTGGRAMLRLVHRSPEDLKVQANISAPLPHKPPEEKPYRRTRKSTESNEVMDEESAVEKTDIRPVQKKTDLDLLKLAREKRKLPESPVRMQETQVPSPRTRPKVDQEQAESMEVDEIGRVENIDEQKFETESQPVEDNFVFLGERNALLFSLETARSVSSDDLPDDFFELTIDDAKRLLKDIRNKRAQMENAPLVTSETRNLEETKKQLRLLNQYKKAIIRVQFPNRTVLQGNFNPSETVQHIVDFVREYLDDKLLEFYLYTTPPKTVLDKQSTLIEIGCVPGALLHFGTNDGQEIKLRKDVLDKFTTNDIASRAASKIRKETTRKTSFSDTNINIETIDDANRAGPSDQSTSYERKIYKTTEKVPKWFKPV